MHRILALVCSLLLVGCFEPVSPETPRDARADDRVDAGMDAAASRDAGPIARPADAAAAEPDGATVLDSCVPDCLGRQCGDDGCGGSCGQCQVADAAILDASVGADAAQPTCSDGLRNGGESDVDCGGWVCGATCEYGAGCQYAADCQTGMICNVWSRRCDCAAGWHHCEAGCRSDDDPANCGAACNDCAASAPGNAIATCRNAACDFECLPGFCKFGGGCGPLSPLTLTIGGDGGGTVLAAGLTCAGRACAGDYCPDAEVTLTAESAPGSAVRWGQDCAGAGGRPTCKLTMSQARTASVDFLQGGVTLTVTVSGVDGASGEISSMAYGVACGQECVVTVPRGTVVDLSESPAGGFFFGGWGGACSGFEETCSVLMGGDQVVTASFSPANFIFVTSTAYDVTALGGVSGADAVCQARAAAAGLPGTYVAWLSTTAASARERIGSARGWVRTDKKPFADTFDSGPGSVPAVFYSPSLDEFGAPAQPRPVLTGTTFNGDLSPENCNDFTSLSGGALAGYPTSGAETWTASWYLCGVSTSLYCLEVDRRVALRFTPAEGRRAFLTNSSFSASAGLAAADALCMAEAGTAGLAGRFKALLSTSTVAATARFVDGPAWVRSDGVRVVERATDLLQGGIMDQVIDVSADGRTYLGNKNVWIGSSDPTLPGTGATNCEDWTTNANSSLGTSTQSGLLTFPFYHGETTCGFWDSYLFCLQE